MKAIEINLGAEVGSARIIPVADAHIGDRCCDIQLLRETIGRIRDGENTYCVLNGDLLDTAVATSIGDTYGADIQPMQQLETAVSLFGGISDKILCVTHGNHENRVYKSDGIDLTALMCRQLGIYDRYSDTTAYLFIRLGNNTRHQRPTSYTMYVTHGGGGGRKVGGKFNRLQDLSGICDADIYVHSHTHVPAVFRERFFRSYPTSSTVSLEERVFVNTSAYLDYGGYGDVQGYRPNSKMSPVIVLSGKEKKISVEI